MDDNGLKWRSLKTPVYELDWGLAASLATSSDRGARQGMPALGFLVEVGPKITFNIAQTAHTKWTAELPLRVVLDMSHSASYKGLTTEPELVVKIPLQAWTLQSSASVVVSDLRKSEFLYGVDAAYATASRPRYAACWYC